MIDLENNLKSIAIFVDAKKNPNEIIFFNELIDEIICYKPQLIDECFKRLENYQAQGFYLVGCLNYELGYLFDPALENHFRGSNFPLLAFKIFKKKEIISYEKLSEKININQNNESFIYNFNLIDDYQTYQNQFKKVQKALKEGETYQINLTSKYKFNFQGDSINLFFKLIKQQSAAYNVFFQFDSFDILSISPELFFKKQGDKLICKPMKGTVKRDSNLIQDQKNKEFLQNDPKNKTENVIIVDLLRNDLSHISEKASVNVPKLFDIETFETVFQMTSTVESKLKKNINLKTMIQSLFPCGSITGAPKVSTMKHIANIETEPRNLYTGSIGFIEPNGDMCWNVAIRTLLLDQKNKKGELGAGGGITISSEVSDEYDELKLKANFVKNIEKPFNLIEAILLRDNQYQHLSRHLDRLENSAKTFNFKFNREELIQSLDKYKQNLDQKNAYKIRIEYNSFGQFLIESSDANPINQPIKLTIASERVDSSNILFQHKTTAESVRGFYNQLFKKYREEKKCFDVLFLNKKGYITETSIFNILIELNGKYYTPKITDGLLPGIGREILLENGFNKQKIIEKNISLDELLSAENIWVINSIRGLLKSEVIYKPFMELMKTTN